jgi:hypothetical protein
VCCLLTSNERSIAFFSSSYHLALCNTTSNSTFQCLCDAGWEGLHCETMINFCENILCQNNGVCRPTLQNFSCECLGGSFSGLYCEITSAKIAVLKTVSRSFASIAIVAISAVIIFVAGMDALKYFFGIDPVQSQLNNKPERKKKKKIASASAPIAMRFIYVN